MSRFTYMLNKVQGIDKKRLSALIDKISKDNGRSRSYVLRNMISDFLKYGISYTDYIKGNYINLSDAQKREYITTKNFYKIVYYFNDKNYWMLFHDKIIFNELFRDFIKRDFIDLRRVSYQDFICFIEGRSVVYAKKNNSFGGDGVSKIRLDKESDYKKLYKYLLENKQYLVEEEIIQHPDLNKFNPTVVNNIRIVTLLKDGKVSVLAKVFRTNSGERDVMNCDDICALLDSDGNIIGNGVDDYCNVYTHHPKTNFKFSDLKVPYMEESIEMVKKAAIRVPEMRYVGWDIAISPNGPVMLEGNNCPEYGLHQNCYFEGKKNVGQLKEIKKFIGTELDNVKL